MAVARQLTDVRGRFAIEGLAAGDYLVRVERRGYLGGGFGQRRGDDAALTPIALAEGQWFDKADVELWPPGRIAGRVIDDGGRPMGGVFVHALRREPTVAGARWDLAATVVSDDRGEYRFFTLAPAEYVVMVPVAVNAVAERPQLASGGVAGHYPWPPATRDGRPRTYPATFSGNTSEVAGATLLDVASGVERVIDITMAPSAARRISGALAGGLRSSRAVGLALVLDGFEPSDSWATVAATSVRDDGTFTFDGIPEGAYVLSTSPRGPARQPVMAAPTDFFYAPQPRIPVAATESPVWTEVRVRVSGQSDVRVEVALHPEATMSGRVEGHAASTSQASVTTPCAELRRVQSGVAIRARTEGAAFVFDRLAPGTFQFVPSATGSVPESVIVNGREMLKQPLEIGLGQQVTDVVMRCRADGAELSGLVVQDATTGPVLASVLVFPDDRARWARLSDWPYDVFTVRAATNGRFAIARVPQGNYRVVAVPDSGAEDWRDFPTLARLATRASPIRLSWGDRRRVELRLAAGGF